MANKTAYKIIRKLLKKKDVSFQALSKIKREFSKKHGISLISNITLTQAYRQLVREKKIRKNEALLKLLRRRKIRTLSGVSVITVLTKPYPCPGKCLYCPNEKGMPKSYLKNEPAAQRAFLNKFDPYKQVKMRLKALEMTGHPTDKIEMIVLGGSWTSYPEKYKSWFIKRLFEACNNPLRRSEASRPAPPKRGEPAPDLVSAQKINEKARHRIIGLSLETRPDLITETEAWQMREFGATRVEIGVQSIYPEILKKNNRGHGVEEIVRATKILKDFGFKVIYHLMPNLPGSTPVKDLKMFKTIFTDERFQPDMLKIYPCAVLKTAPLYKFWQRKKYKPYSQKTLNKLLVNIKKIIPAYVRINRLIRDIPGNSIIAGNKITNLRQLLQNQKVKCRCIRCREARQKEIKEKDLILVKRKYISSGGTEYFLSFETRDKKTLYAFLRLRLPEKNIARYNPAPALSKKDFTPISTQTALPALSPGTAIIRELHTYGQSLPIQRRAGAHTRPKAVQHSGLGHRLMREAEKTAKNKGYPKIAVISGVGVREYYRRQGYSLEKTYLVKNFDKKIKII